MKGYVDVTGLERLINRLQEVRNPQFKLVMLTFERIIVEDNRKGVLAGLDKDGNPMAPVTYRPVGKKTAVTARQKNNAKGKGKFGGLGPMAAGLHNNLSSAEYRKLGGKPLAPRGAFSRVITNLRPGHEKISSHVWEAYAFWADVVSQKGKPFLHAHFLGIGQKVRDLRGVRPEGHEKARKAAIAWMSDQIRYLATGTRRAG